MADFLQALRSGRVLLMDGAMGTELQKLGLRSEDNGSAWNLLYPKRVRAVHHAYFAAGARVHLSNTFMANANSLFATLGDAGIKMVCTDEVWSRDYELMAPPGAPIFRLAAHGPISGEKADREFDSWSMFHPLWSRGCYEGADAVLLETCSSPRARYALGYVQERGWPTLLSLTFQHTAAGKLVTFSGHSPGWFAKRAVKYGIVALGVNCGREIDMDDIIEIIRRYRAETDLPLFARPNAGTPTKQGDKWVYPHTPEAMAARLPELLAAGVSMIGGCCGTTPEHIAAFREVVNVWNRNL
jgi:methionine synthase I (cobalamin-dependent)